jgi:hypothetical protein
MECQMTQHSYCIRLCEPQEVARQSRDFRLGFTPSCPEGALGFLDCVATLAKTDQFIL